MILNEQIKAIAERLSALREVLDLTLEDISSKTGISPEQIKQFESGEYDIPMSFICNVAQAYNIQPSAIISGDEPKMQSYFLTRKGKGVSMERNKHYKYLALAAGFKDTLFVPFEVTISPFDKINLNSHSGQEFNYLLEGRVLIQLGDKQLIMNPGDSIFFNSNIPHGMIALDNQEATFLAIISK